MKWRLENNRNHWIHDVRAEKEQPAVFLTSLTNNMRRKPFTFAQLEENGTTPGTYAYAHVRNSYSYEDIQAKKKNESYAAKRQRRA